MINQREKLFSFPFRKCSSCGRLQGRTAPGKDGYALLIVMMMATLLLISLSAALPNIYVEGQREKEKELIFRGQQYARAIMLFHKQFNRYPNSIKELLHTDNMSFLRRAYRDPMAKNGKWRYIHATASGIILDSKLLGKPGRKQNHGLNSNANSSTSLSSVSGGNPAATPGQNTAGNNGLSLFAGRQQSSTAAENPNQPGAQSSSIFGDQNKLIGAYIVGVASTSTKASIMVYENHDHYDDWEFLGVPGAPGGPAAAPVVAAPGVGPGGAGQNPGSRPGAGGGFHLGSAFGGASNPH